MYVCCLSSLLGCVRNTVHSANFVHCSKIFTVQSEMVINGGLVSLFWECTNSQASFSFHFLFNCRLLAILRCSQLHQKVYSWHWIKRKVISGVFTVVYRELTNKTFCFYSCCFCIDYNNCMFIFKFKLLGVFWCCFNFSVYTNNTDVINHNKRSAARNKYIHRLVI